MTKVLVTGGAGYIGSHTVKELSEAGYEVVIIDNLSSGHRDAVKGHKLYVGDLANKEDLRKVFSENKIDAVLHFAGSIEAGESMTDPRRFYENNVVNGLNLLDVMLENGVKDIVFSSSAAVYGNPSKMPINEDAPKQPTNVYGLTKLMFEQILDSYDFAYGLKSISLRYFNAAGADPAGKIGPDHKHKTHLITLVMLAALGKLKNVKIMGTDYPTKDGTGVRDYIHVNDLARAHILALEFLTKNKKTDKFNLGNERGVSVREVIDTAKKISGKEIEVIEEPRRIGDPAEIVASARKARKILGWKPSFDSIEAIEETAWKWHQSHPNGYLR